ncbi:hypothetical protein QJS10_CPB11g00866 [Acorus calamus]|uniref:Uncharacterized protein n=1 Tax=Acorus calamus TaxID=4465 RepID=A0AAV9DSA9_ACOCL|nr:hypothetical protein QJS10_CPB11g00866 [Acorus calamus]
MNSMEETDDSSRNDMMQRLQFSFSSNPLQRYPFQNQSPPSNPFSNPSQIRSSALLRHLPQSDASTANKRGIPPVSPYRPPSPAQNPPSGGGGPNPQPCHTRSLSQPAFYSFDSFPPLSPSPYKDSSSPSPSATSDPVSADVSMDDGGSRDALPPSPAPLPPRKAAHRRSLSEVSFSFPGLGGALSAATPPPLPRPFDRPNPSAKLVKQESSDWEKDVGDRGDPKSDEDLFAAYMNLEQIDTLNSSGTDDKREDLDSRASGSRTNGVDSSDNEAESSLSTQRGGNPSPNVSNNHHKRSHAGGDVGAPRHCRSISMDSFIMGKMNFGEESPNIPPSQGPRLGQHSHSNSMDGVTNSTFSLDFGNGEFSTSDLKKIMANEKLAEMAMVDPKRVKRKVLGFALMMGFVQSPLFGVAYGGFCSVQDTCQPAICGTLQGAEDAVYLGVGAEGADTADGSNHVVSATDFVTKGLCRAYQSE